MEARFFSIVSLVLQRFGSIAGGGMLALATGEMLAAADTNSMVFLETGSGRPLLSLDYLLNVPDFSISPRLAFDFGLATSERLEPGQFLDSFSITLQGGSTASTAMLLTADAYGVQWAPPNEGGMAVDSSTLARQSSTFPDLVPSLAYRYAFSVLWIVPRALAGQLATLYFDLFDNQNNLATMAFIKAVQVITSTPPPLPPWPLVQSSANPAGPYADETGAVVNTNQMSVAVGKQGPNRFYRVRSNTPLTIRQFSLSGGDLMFAYEFMDVAVVLQSAARIEGPYRDEVGYTIDPVARSIHLVRPAESRFYRIRSFVPVILSHRVLTAGEWVLSYEYHPAVLGLESSSQAPGPYAIESAVIFDHEKQTLKLAASRSARFYRVRPDSPYRFTRVRGRGNDLVMSYEMRGN